MLTAQRFRQDVHLVLADGKISQVYSRMFMAYDSANRTALYSNPMTDTNRVVAEYGVHEDSASACLDGGI